MTYRGWLKELTEFRAASQRDQGVQATLMGSLIMRSRTMVFLCSTVLALAPAAAQERMYKCVDAGARSITRRCRLRSAWAATRRS